MKNRIYYLFYGQLLKDIQIKCILLLIDYLLNRKVYAEIKDELSKRDLTSKQRKNYQDIVNLFIYHS